MHARSFFSQTYAEARAKFIVGAEAPQGVNIALEAGEVAETVTVSAGDATTGLQTETANVSKAITTEEVLRLPQVGRDPYELIRLTPGVFGDGALLVGDEDGVTPPALSQELARIIDGSRIEIIEGSGHLANAEQPQAFNKAIESFLSEQG